jgi:hypothetical protein
VTGSMKFTVFKSYNNTSFTKRPVYHFFGGGGAFTFWSTKITFYCKAESVKLLGLQVPVDNSVVVY